MKLLYVLNATATRGGATKSFLVLAEALAADGNEIAVVVPDKNGITSKLKAMGWNVVCVPFVYSALPRVSGGLRDIIRFIPRAVRGIVINRKAKKKVLRFAKVWGADLVHDNTSVTDIGHYVARELCLPHVTHIREYGWQDFKIAIIGLKKRLAWKYSFAVAITSRLAKFRGKNMAEDHILTVYNGIVKEIPCSYIEKKDPYIFYAGRILQSKGVADLVDAYVDYAKEEINAGRNPLILMLAGEEGADGCGDIVRKKLKEGNLTECVEWLGNVENVSDYYKRAVSTIVPSYNEGFGRVMPEAIASGCLCVVRNSAGLAEQLENGRKVTGDEIALSFNSTEDLTQHLKDISQEYRNETAFQEGGKYKNMIDKGRTTVESLYTYDAYVNAIKHLYSRAVIESKKQHS